MGRQVLRRQNDYRIFRGHRIHIGINKHTEYRIQYIYTQYYVLRTLCFWLLLCSACIQICTHMRVMYKYDTLYICTVCSTASSSFVPAKKSQHNIYCIQHLLLTPGESQECCTACYVHDSRGLLSWRVSLLACITPFPPPCRLHIYSLA